MCIFSGPVDAVSETQIFARATTGDRQIVVYRMSLQAQAPVAMILPLPVARGSDEGAVRFISLEGYPKFFDDLESAWAVTDGDVVPGALSLHLPRSIAVHQVGAFEASFVPTLADFERLDPRFRLPGAVPGVDDRGFVVFQIREPSALRPDGIHPMAFEFPRRDAERLFFPTMHLHDGEFHAVVEFEHDLYLQAPAGRHPSVPAAATPTDFEFLPSDYPAERVMKRDLTAGTIDFGLPLWRAHVWDDLPNRDTEVEFSAPSGA